jgi:hypothetical protein
MPQTEPARVSYGWWVVLAAFLNLFFAEDMAREVSSTREHSLEHGYRALTLEIEINVCWAAWQSQRMVL